MKKSWWKVPVYCMAASWVCFQMEVHFLGKWTIVTLPDGSLSSDNTRWLILSAVLFLAVVCIGGFFLFRKMTHKEIFFSSSALVALNIVGNVKKCAVGKYPKSEKHGNTAQFSEVERSGTQENCGGIGSGCRLRLRPLPVLHRRQSKRVARIDPNAVVVDKNIAENDRFDLFSR